MPNKVNNVKVGAVTLTGLIVFLLIISFLGVFNFGGNMTVHVMYEQVNGLKVGNEVRYAGVLVGKVSSVKLTKNGVKVTLRLNADVEIPDDSTFAIGTDGIMGAKFVAINPVFHSTGAPLKDGQSVIGEKPQGMDQLMTNSDKILDKLDDVVEAFRLVFGDERVQEAMREGFINTGEITKNMNNLTKALADSAIDNKVAIREMITNLHSISRHLDSVVKNADAGGATGANVAAMAKNMAETSKRLNNMAKSLEEVLADPKTTKHLKDTISNIHGTTDKANRTLGIITDAKLQADVLYGTSGDKRWRTDVGVKFSLRPDTSLYVGASNIGTDNKLDLNVSKDLNKTLTGRAGIMQGSFGVGVDVHLGKQFKIFSDVYDFNDTKIKVGAEYALNKNFSVIGENMNVRKGGQTTYLGIRTYF